MKWIISGTAAHTELRKVFEGDASSIIYLAISELPTEWWGMVLDSMNEQWTKDLTLPIDHVVGQACRYARGQVMDADHGRQRDNPDFSWFFVLESGFNLLPEEDKGPLKDAFLCRGNFGYWEAELLWLNEVES